MLKNIAMVCLLGLTVAACKNEGEDEGYDTPAQANAVERAIAPYCTKPDKDSGFRGCFAIVEFADSHYHKKLVGLVTGMRKNHAIWATISPDFPGLAFMTPGAGFNKYISIVAVHELTSSKGLELLERYKTQRLGYI